METLVKIVVKTVVISGVAYVSYKIGKGVGWVKGTVGMAKKIMNETGLSYAGHGIWEERSK